MLPPPPTDPYVTNSVIRFVSNDPFGPRTCGLRDHRRHGCCCPSKRNLLRLDFCALRTSSVKTVVGLKVPSAFPWHRRHAPALPSRASTGVIVGPLGLSSPRVRAEVAPCPAVLCVATTAFVLPGRFAFGSLPVPWVDALVFVSLFACAEVGSSAGRVGQHTPGCCLGRSPSLRRLLPRRREALPSSRVTPLNTCPALRPRWCPTGSPWCVRGCCLPVGGSRRLWLRLLEAILLSTTIRFSGFNSAACVLASPLLRTLPFATVALRFGCRTGV